jgi:hypothetical protein
MKVLLIRASGRRCDRVVHESATARGVFAAAEKTAIQALDRLNQVLPLSPGRAERHGFEYYRHGLRSYAGEYVGIWRQAVARMPCVE